MLERDDTELGCGEGFECAVDRADGCAGRRDDDDFVTLSVVGLHRHGQWGVGDSTLERPRLTIVRTNVRRDEERRERAANIITGGRGFVGSAGMKTGQS